jgi:CO dehydrogenase nickel-insertion accessory protein CooC1
LNNAHEDHIPDVLKNHIDLIGVPLLGMIPYDEKVAEYDSNGNPLIQLGEDSIVYRSVSAMLAKVLADIE